MCVVSVVGDASGDAPLFLRQVDGPVNSVKFDATGQYLAVGSNIAQAARHRHPALNIWGRFAKQFLQHIGRRLRCFAVRQSSVVRPRLVDDSSTCRPFIDDHPRGPSSRVVFPARCEALAKRETRATTREVGGRDRQSLGRGLLRRRRPDQDPNKLLDKL